MTVIAMLEDDLERIERFRAVLRSNHPGKATGTSPGTQLLVQRTAWSFIDAYLLCAQPPDLIALDHDLFTDSPDDPDPGDGREVARFLADCNPACPVLIHSTNAPAADSMLFCLLDAGWIADRIAPLGGDWICIGIRTQRDCFSTRHLNENGEPID